jgi:hypothetical protein
MKKLFTRSFIRALIITVLSALIIVGGIYAFETLWSGKANITIEPPESEGQLEITGTRTEDSGSGSYGTWDESTKTWTVSLPRGTWASIRLDIKNTGDDLVEVQKCVDGTCYDTAHSVQIATGVRVNVSGACDIAAGETHPVIFEVRTESDAEPGTLPEVQLEIRTG